MNINTTTVVRYIKGLTHEGDIKALNRISTAVENATIDAMSERERNRKAAHDAAMAEVCTVMGQIYGCVRDHRDVPGHLVNSACRLLRKSSTDCGFPTDGLHPPGWYRHIPDFDVACVEAFRLIRKYVNSRRTKEYFRGRAKWVKQLRRHKKETPELRVWSWFTRPFHYACMKQWIRTKRQEHNVDATG